MIKVCLSCGLQFPDTTLFCSGCGRPVEVSFAVRSLEHTEVEQLQREIQEKDRQIQKLSTALRQRDKTARTSAYSISYPGSNSD
jgi:predicted Fe-S protein YdhL (DUF1289 family)